MEENYIASRATWRHALGTFCDLLAGSPAICIGVDADAEAFLDLVGEMLGSRETRPSSMIFLADSPLLEATGFQNLVRGRIPCFSFNGSISDLALRISEQESFGRTKKLDFGNDGGSVLVKYSELCVRVENKVPSSFPDLPITALLDSLFSPANLDWTPFHFELDLRRTIEKDVVSCAKRIPNQDIGVHACIAVVGSSANGKTTLLKRLALEFSKNELFTIWFTSLPMESPDRTYNELFRDLRSENSELKRIVAVIDDPSRNRRGEVNCLLKNAAANGFDITLVIAVRSSDWAAENQATITGHNTTVHAFDLNDDFEDAEVQLLPSYLVKIEAAQDEGTALKMLDSSNPKKAKDVLNTLYAVVPSTRPSIVSSVRDEYCRLGDISGLRSQVQGTYDIGTEAIKDAYELTCVADVYGVGLPFEVLRASIGLDWGQASDLIGSNSAVWGILYPIEVGDFVSLKSRNEIVANTIVNFVNGGAFSRRQGELRNLKRMIAACQGRSGLTYRNFLKDLLVGNEQLERLSFDDGFELFEDALDALGVPDKLLKHHMGLWCKKHDKTDRAMTILQEALDTPDYPYTSSMESESNICTSLASSILAEIKSGKRDLITGKEEAEKYIARARKASVGNAHVVHVSANVTLELIKTMPHDDTNDILHVATNAVSDIDSLSMLDDSPVRFKKKSKKTEGLLQQTKENLYVHAMQGRNTEEFADTIWQESNNQDGFVIGARKKLSELRSRGKSKGSAYKELYDYVLSCREKIKSCSKAVDRRLSEVQAEIFYWWRIHRAMLNPIDIDINWTELLELLNEVCAVELFGQQKFYEFLKALCLAHLGDWEGAEAVFAHFRRSDIARSIVWLPRAYLLNAAGGKRTVQGIVREHGGKTYLEVEELGKTLQAERRDRWSAPEEIDHANVVFCFGGMRAVHDL